MKRHAQLFLTLLAIVFGVAACGGSASETPPPLEPAPAPVAVEETPSAPASSADVPAPSGNY